MDISDRRETRINIQLQSLPGAMDLSLLARTTAAMREEEEEVASQLTSKRPKLSNFSVASLLASAQRPRSPDRAPEEVETRSRAEEEEEDMVKEEEDEQEMTDEESDVSVDSHGEEEAGMLYSNSRLNDSSDLDGDSSTHRSTSSPLSSSDASNRPVSPPRSSEGLPGHPRLAMPTPLLGGRAGFPGLPPGVHLPPGIFPPGWHGLLPPPGLPNLFKSGELDFCIFSHLTNYIFAFCIIICTCIYNIWKKWDW